MTEYTAGSASVPITPDFSDFHTRISEELDELEPQFAAAGDKSGAAFASAFQDQLKASFADLPDAVIKADADTTEADAELDEAAKTRTATVKVNVDKSSLSQVKSALSGIGESGSKLAGNAGTLGAATAVIGLAPQALGAAVGVAGIGVGLVAAAADAGAFGAIAVPMFTKVTTAQQALTTAQAAYAKATTSSGRATALKAEQAALAGLTPAEKQLATELTGLTTAWGSLQKAEEPVVGAAIAPWLATATSGMQLLNPLIDEGSGAIQELGTDAGEALQNPFWTTFSQTLGTTGQLALTSFGTAAGSLADGLAHLFVTFAPDIDSLLTDIPTLAGDFDTWAKSVTSSGLESFFGTTFSHANLQTLKGDLTSVGSFFGTVATATSEISPLAFNGLSVLLEAIGELPPDAVIALTGLFLATKTIGAIGNIASLAGSVISLGKSAAGLIGGLFSGAAATAEATTEGTAVGAAAGSAAATAFTGTFGPELNAALPTAFLSIGTTLATEADAAGTVWGTAAATTFGTAFAAEDALGVTAALTAVGVSGAVEADVAGAAIGAAAAAGFAEGVAGVGTALGSAVGTAGVVALVGAGLAGAALGTAVGVGFTTAFGVTGAGNVISGLETSVKNGAGTSSTWLTVAGQQAAQGFIIGLTSQAAAVQAAAAQAKTWSSAGASGSSAWLAPSGTQAGQGFGNGFTSAHAFVDSSVGQMKTWILSALPSNSIISLLTPAGASVAEGFANGIISGASFVISAAESIANTASSIISSALNINSPSKVMMPIGSAVPEGMAVGMLGGSGFITSAGSQLATITAQSLGGIASAQSLGALSALGVPSISAAPRLPGVSAPLNSGQLQLQVSYASTGNALTDAVVGALRYDIGANTGGDVQAHLGQGQVRTGG